MLKESTSIFTSKRYVLSLVPPIEHLSRMHILNTSTDNTPYPVSNGFVRVIVYKPTMLAV